MRGGYFATRFPKAFDERQCFLIALVCATMLFKVMQRSETVPTEEVAPQHVVCPGILPAVAVERKQEVMDNSLVPRLERDRNTNALLEACVEWPSLIH